MISEVFQENAKKVTTFSPDGQENGFLIELFKDVAKTVVYISATHPGSFKGYHLHRVRAARYVCLKGKMKVVLYRHRENSWVREEHILDSTNPERLFIPKDTATGLENIGDSDGWLVNYPEPAYDPDLVDEQVEYTKEELEQGVVK